MDELLKLFAYAALAIPITILWALGPWSIFELCIQALTSLWCWFVPDEAPITWPEVEVPLKAAEGPTIVPLVLAANQPPSGQDTALQPRFVEKVDQVDPELVEARLRLRSLERTLATTEDIPEGKLLLRGRVVPANGKLSIIPKNGKPFRVNVALGWEFPCETGDQCLVEAIYNANGWTAWRVIVEQLNGQQKPLDEALVAKLTAKKEPRKAPDFDELDLESAQNAVRTASHSKTAISLHIVLPTHCRFSLTEEQAEDLKQLVVELVEEIDLGQVAAIEVGNTEGGNQRDHLHLLITAFNHTGDSIGKQVGRLKALSSGRLRRKYPGLREKLWSASYWVSSAGGSLDKVIAYIGDNETKYS